MKPNSRQTEALRTQWHLPHNTAKLHRLMQCIQIYIQAARLITCKYFCQRGIVHVCVSWTCLHNSNAIKTAILSHNPLNLWHKASETSDPQVPSPLQSITAMWPIPDHTAQWQHHNVWEQLVWVTVWKWNAGKVPLFCHFRIQGPSQGLSTTTVYIPKDIPVDL